MTTKQFIILVAQSTIAAMVLWILMFLVAVLG
jgi:hypothetical protein